MFCLTASSELTHFRRLRSAIPLRSPLSTRHLPGNVEIEARFMTQLYTYASTKMRRFPSAREASDPLNIPDPLRHPASLPGTHGGGFCGTSFHPHQAAVYPREEGTVHPSKVQDYLSLLRVRVASSPVIGDGESEAVTPGRVRGGHLWRLHGEGVPEVRVDGHIIALRETERYSVEADIPCFPPQRRRSGRKSGGGIAAVNRSAWEAGSVARSVSHSAKRKQCPTVATLFASRGPPRKNSCCLSQERIRPLAPSW